MELNRFFQSGPRFELCEQLIGKVDVPSPLNFWQHDNVDFVAHLGHDACDVVEEPRAIEAIDTRPQLGITKVIVTCYVDKAITCRFFVFDCDRVLKVAQQDINFFCDARGLLHHARITGIKEMNHARGPNRYVSQWRRRTKR